MSPLMPAYRLTDAATFGGSEVAFEHGSPVGAQDSGEGWIGAADVGQSRFDETVGCRGQGGFVVFVDRAVGQDVFLQHEEPAVDQRSEGTSVTVADGEAFDESAVHGLEVMQRRLGLGDLDLARDEPGPTGTIGDPS